jgi:AI-2 transport protein TqsA
MTTGTSGTGERWSLPRGLIILLGGAGAVVAVAGMRAFAGILGPVFLALMLTVTVHPVFGMLRRRGWPVWLSIIVTLLGVLLIIVAVAASLALALGQLASLLPTYEDRFNELLDQATAQLAAWGVGPDQVRAALGKVGFGAVTGFLGSLLGGLAEAFSDLLFLVTLLLFMGIDAAQFPSRLDMVAPQRPEVVAAFNRFAKGTRSYLAVTTVFGLIVAVLDTSALWLLGVPLPLVWGLLSFITNYIPNIGFVIGLIPPALLALLDGGPKLMLLVILVYTVINVVLQEFIQPKFVGDAVDLSVTLTMLSLVFWTFVLGPLGALLAIPLTLLAKALIIDIDPDTRWLGALITMRMPAPAAPAPAPAPAAAPPEPAASPPTPVAAPAAPGDLD